MLWVLLGDVWRMGICSAVTLPPFLNLIAGEDLSLHQAGQDDVVSTLIMGGGCVGEL